MSTSKAELEAYMERHGIKELLRDLTQELAYERPEQPVKLLHEKLGAMLGDDCGGPDAATPNGAGSSATAPTNFVLKMHVEAAGRGGSVVRHVARRSLHAKDLRAWTHEASAALAHMLKSQNSSGSSQQNSSRSRQQMYCTVALTFENLCTGGGVRLPRRPERAWPRRRVCCSLLCWCT